jgi:hypothetical protein
VDGRDNESDNGQRDEQRHSPDLGPNSADCIQYPRQARAEQFADEDRREN